MIKKQIYQTDDGKTFEDKNKAAAHEQGLKAEKSLKAFLYRFTSEAKDAELAEDASAMETLYAVVAARFVDASVQPTSMAELLWDVMKAHPVEAAQVIKGTFGTRAKKRAAKKSATKKSAAKKSTPKTKGAESSAKEVPAAPAKKIPPVPPAADEGDTFVPPAPPPE